MPARLPIEPYMWMLCYRRGLLLYVARSAGVGVKLGGPTSNKGFSQSGTGVEYSGYNIVSAMENQRT